MPNTTLEVSHDPHHLYHKRWTGWRYAFFGSTWTLYIVPGTGRSYILWHRSGFCSVTHSNRITYGWMTMTWDNPGYADDDPCRTPLSYLKCHPKIIVTPTMFQSLGATTFGHMSIDKLKYDVSAKISDLLYFILNVASSLIVTDCPFRMINTSMSRSDRKLISFASHQSCLFLLE